MALTRAEADELAADLYDSLSEALPARRMLADYYSGQFPLPYIVSPNARREYRALLQKARVNFIRVALDAIAERLMVDGIGTNIGEDVDADIRRVWTGNDMPSRQGITHVDALIFGETSVSVWPGESDDEPPRVRPESPMQTWLEPDPYDADVLSYAAKRIAAPRYRQFRFWLYEPDVVHRYTGDLNTPDLPPAGTFNPSDTVYEQLENPMGALPFVAFRNAPDSHGGYLSEVADIKASQDRINQTLFSRIMVAEYASFRQRWATGIAVPRDPKTGEPIEPFEAAVNRLWVNEAEGGKFGEFSQSSMADHISAIEQDLELMAAQSRVPVTYLISKLANVSGEALESLEAGLVAKVKNRQRMFNRPWRDVVSLLGLATGNQRLADNPKTSINWHEAERRTLSQLADGLGKLHQQLSVPLQVTWEWLGATEEDITEWAGLLAAEQAEAAMQQAIQLGQTLGYQPEQVTSAQVGNGNVAAAGQPAT